MDEDAVRMLDKIEGCQGEQRGLIDYQLLPPRPGSHVPCDCVADLPHSACVSVLARGACSGPIFGPGLVQTTGEGSDVAANADLGAAQPNQ